MATCTAGDRLSMKRLHSRSKSSHGPLLPLVATIHVALPPTATFTAGDRNKMALLLCPMLATPSGVVLLLASSTPVVSWRIEPVCAGDEVYTASPSSPRLLGHQSNRVRSYRYIQAAHAMCVRVLCVRVYIFPSCPSLHGSQIKSDGQRTKMCFTYVAYRRVSFSVCTTWKRFVPSLRRPLSAHPPVCVCVYQQSRACNKNAKLHK